MFPSMDINLLTKTKLQRVIRHIPNEIIYYGILTRLPSKSLVRFKSVCKNWYTLITSSTFIDLHQKYTLESQDYSNDDVFIVSLKFGGNTCFFTYVDDHHSTSVRKFEIENIDDDHSFSIAGSCNGLICLKKSIKFSGFKLCNPLTKECSKLIDLPRLVYNGYKFHKYGFGYDLVRHDYKIVIFTMYWRIGIVQVYNTSTDSWKVIEEISPNLYVREPGVALNNTLHWIGSSQTNDHYDTHNITTFDLHTEKLGKMPYPTTPNPSHSYSLGLMVSNGRLHTVMRNTTTKCVTIWTMKEYGVSWIKLCEFEVGDFRHCNVLTFNYRSRMNFEEVLMTIWVDKDPKQLVWYNVKDKSVRRLGNGTYELAHEWVCRGSLAPIPNIDKS